MSLLYYFTHFLHSTKWVKSCGGGEGGGKKWGGIAPSPVWKTSFPVLILYDALCMHGMVHYIMLVQALLHACRDDPVDLRPGGAVISVQAVAGKGGVEVIP